MFRFANTYMFWFLLFIPVMAGLGLLFLRWKKKRRRQLADTGLEQKIIPDYSRSKVIIRLVLYILIYTGFVVVLARPRFGKQIQKVKKEGIDFVIALDLSNSMLAEDIKPNRLIRSRQAISTLLDNMNNDRVGLVAFAGIADLQSTITTDYASVKNILPTLDTELLEVQGTSIADAIRMSIKAFPKELKSGAAIVILTDGEDHEGEAVEAARDARKMGIIVHTIGIGTVQGGAIPIYSKGVLKGYKTDKNGQTVVTKMNETALKEISDAGGGIYVRGTDPSAALKEVYKEMQSMQKAEREELNEEGMEDQFQWFLGFVLLLLIAEVLISDRKSKWLKKIEIFD